MVTAWSEIAMTANLVLPDSSSPFLDASHSPSKHYRKNKSSSAQTTRDSRRANKPLMEKRRRARINQSLAVLKAIILDSAKMENTKHSKLEKADILELTVRHLQRQKVLGSTSIDKYKAGFLECVREVTRFLESELLSSPKAMEMTVKQRLIRHLESCAGEIDLDFSPNALQAKALDEAAERRLDQLEDMLGTETTKPDSSTQASCGDENNNPRRRKKSQRDASAQPLSPGPSTSTNLSLVQVIPSRLPDGQVVFLLPSHYVQVQDKEQQEMPIDFSVKKSPSERDDDVWRPW